MAFELSSSRDLSTVNDRLWLCEPCRWWTVRHPNTPALNCPKCGRPLQAVTLAEQQQILYGRG